MAKFVDPVKGKGEFFTQIYDLLGLTVPVMVILVHVYDVNLLQPGQDQSASLGVVGGSSKSAFSGIGRQWVNQLTVAYEH